MLSTRLNAMSEVTKNSHTTTTSTTGTHTHAHTLARCARTVQSCPCKFNEFSALVVHGVVQGRGLSRELSREGREGNCTAELVPGKQ